MCSGDVDNKKQLGEVILKGLSALSIPASVITVEIIDMERESYGKYAPGCPRFLLYSILVAEVDTALGEIIG